MLWRFPKLKQFSISIKAKIIIHVFFWYKNFNCDRLKNRARISLRYRVMEMEIIAIRQMVQVTFTTPLFEPTCANCTVGSYASLSVCLSICLWQKSDYIIIHICLSICMSYVRHMIVRAINSILNPILCANLKVSSMSMSSCIF